MDANRGGRSPAYMGQHIFDVSVTGVSAHPAKPSDGVDALVVACAMVGELQKIVSREIDPYYPLVISVTGIEAGGAYNIIAAQLKACRDLRDSGLNEAANAAFGAPVCG
ncbi:peptidase dimerization domain-containing protein [Mesorhizobium sp.]|uniref:peptidase dimerization domain-containing protein n=1 Tax=Mesorhizobium sp. TaxID=1871066 RepID=UPI0025C39591|nr:peptidase dimerization domain-containing protein [Mesorhizobium sp.]